MHSSGQIPLKFFNRWLALPECAGNNEKAFSHFEKAVFQEDSIAYVNLDHTESGYTC
jgi:hypothetical protein